MPSKKIYQSRKEQGVCTGCGGSRDTIALKCKECRDQVKNGQVKLIRARQNNFLCVVCGDEVVKDKKYCDKHYSMLLEKSFEARQKCLRERICTRCHNNPAAEAQERCNECIKKTAKAHKNKKEQRKNFNLCLNCGLHPMYETFLTCEYCLEDRKDKLKKDKKIVFNYYGTACKCCGVEQNNFLTIDHIDGGGRTHVKEHGLGNGGSNLYRWIIANDFPAMFQTLCFNCNFAKYVYGTCPHVEISNSICINCKIEPATEMKTFCQECFKFKNLGQRKYVIQRKVDAFKHYGNVCYCCKEVSPIFLCLDHINDDGAKDRELYGSGDKFYSYLKKIGYPQNQYRVSCFNCNSGRAVNGGICPHQEEIITSQINSDIADLTSPNII